MERSIFFWAKARRGNQPFLEAVLIFLNSRHNDQMIADFFLFDSPPSYLYAYLLLDETNNLMQLATYQVFHIPMVLTYFVSNKPKGRISKPVFQENKAHQIFRKKKTFLTPWYADVRIRRRTCAYQGVRNVCFSENSVSFVFLKHLFWDSLFCLITDDFRRAGYIPSEYWLPFSWWLSHLHLKKSIKWSF